MIYTKISFQKLCKRAIALIFVKQNMRFFNFSLTDKYLFKMVLKRKKIVFLDL